MASLHSQSACARSQKTPCQWAGKVWNRGQDPRGLFSASPPSGGVTLGRLALPSLSSRPVKQEGCPGWSPDPLQPRPGRGMPAPFTTDEDTQGQPPRRSRLARRARVLPNGFPHARRACQTFRTGSDLRARGPSSSGKATLFLLVDSKLSCHST